jgi:hypothetical protein
MGGFTRIKKKIFAKNSKFFTEYDSAVDIYYVSLP